MDTDARSELLCKTCWSNDEGDELEYSGEMIPFSILKRICKKTFHPVWEAYVVPFLVQGCEWFTIDKDTLVEVMKDIPMRDAMTGKRGVIVGYETTFNMVDEDAWWKMGKEAAQACASMKDDDCSDDDEK